MSRQRRREAKDLSIFLDSQVQTINETFQILDKAAPSSLEKLDWSDASKHGTEISKLATVAGMLWCEETSDVMALKENIVTYFNVLQGFLLFCHSSTVGAGPTLHKLIHGASKRVMDSSISLFKETISFYETRDTKKRETIPQLTGAVWEACEALKKCPSSNCIAIGRAMTQLGVYIKDIIREMNELLVSDSSTHQGGEEEEEEEEEEEGADKDELSNASNDEGDDLSPEEKFITKSVISVASNTYEVLKEIIRFLTGLVRSKGNKEENVDSLEKLLSCCREISDWINDLGACAYPPQDAFQMKEYVKNLFGGICEVRKDIEIIAGGGTTDGIYASLNRLDSCLHEIQGLLSGDVADGIEKLSI
ncbi:cyclin-D1-binding protein [Rhynchospora pubera]|uniref:Cyclin-D1-binding protein n=1 Tax=Rhynchospora pubera TaxID=906938 RepID=A0AAV8HIH0_9POAL|nr:cyclin-D1-binding protein [Rhynchospora pubera]